MTALCTAPTRLAARLLHDPARGSLLGKEGDGQDSGCNERQRRHLAIRRAVARQLLCGRAYLDCLVESTSGARCLGTQHTPQPEEQEEQEEQQEKQQQSGGAQERGPPGQECSSQGIPQGT